MACHQKRIGFLFAISAWGREEGHHEIHETHESERHSEHAFTRSLPRMPAGSLFRIFRGFPSPAHRPRCIAAGEKRHAPIHHCIRIVKEGGGTCLHFEYGTSFPAWGDVPQFRFVADPSGPAPEPVPPLPTVNPVADTAPKVATGCQRRLTECSFLALPPLSCRPGRKKAPSPPPRGLFPFLKMS